MKRSIRERPTFVALLWATTFCVSVAFLPIAVSGQVTESGKLPDNLLHDRKEGDSTDNGVLLLCAATDRTSLQGRLCILDRTATTPFFCECTGDGQFLILTSASGGICIPDDNTKPLLLLEAGSLSVDLSSKPRVHFDPTMFSDRRAPGMVWQPRSVSDSFRRVGADAYCDPATNSLALSHGPVRFFFSSMIDPDNSIRNEYAALSSSSKMISGTLILNPNEASLASAPDFNIAALLKKIKDENPSPTKSLAEEYERVDNAGLGILIASTPEVGSDRLLLETYCRRRVADWLFTYELHKLAVWKAVLDTKLHEGSPSQKAVLSAVAARQKEAASTLAELKSGHDSFSEAIGHLRATDHVLRDLEHNLPKPELIACAEKYLSDLPPLGISWEWRAASIAMLGRDDRLKLSVDSKFQLAIAALKMRADMDVADEEYFCRCGDTKA